MTFRPMPILTLCAIAGLAVMIWLGSWQMARYNEKLALIEVSPTLETVSVDLAPVPETPLQFVYSIVDADSVWRSFALVEGCIDNACGKAGFLDLALIAGVEPDGVDISDMITSVSGEGYRIVDNGRRTWLSLPDQPEKARWSVANGEIMGAALNRSDAAELVLIEPMQIDLLYPESSGEASEVIDNPFADPSKHDNLPPARHLGYALTWFGLALGLIGVYFALHIARGRFSLRKAS